jgi:hypothetical protein
MKSSSFLLCRIPLIEKGSLILTAISEIFIARFFLLEVEFDVWKIG